MSTSSYPVALDSFQNPSGTSATNNPSLAAGQTLQNDALAALEAKLGISGSADTASVDYRLSGVPSSDKAASLTGTETLSNKTLASPSITGTASVAAGAIPFSALPSSAWTAFSPSPSGYSGAVTVNAARYQRIGNGVWFLIDFAGTSNATTLSFSIPFASQSNVDGGPPLRIVDNGGAATFSGWLRLAAGSLTCNAFAGPAGTAWTASGNKSLQGHFFYECQP